MPQGRDSPTAHACEGLRRYQDLVEASLDLIWQSDAEGRFTYLNPAWEATFGYPIADMLGKRLSDFQSPDTGERDVRELRRLMQAGTVKGYETVCMGKSGAPIYLALDTRPVCDEHGHVTGVLGTAHDITERRQAAEGLARSAQEWQETFDATLDAIWVLDKDHRIVRSNQMAEQMFGRPRGAMIGQHCWQIVHGTTGPIPDCPALRARHSLHRESMQLQLGQGWVAIHLDPILDEDGNYNGSVHIVSDITERKQTEGRLGRALERLDLATNATRLGIWDWDIEKDELVWDDRMYELYGLKREDFAGASAAWLAGVHPDDRDACDRTSQAALRGECAYDTEFRVLWPDGTVRHLHAYGVITRAPDGRPLRMTGSNYDITARKQMEAALREREQQYRMVSELATDYIYKLSVAADGKVTMGFVSDNFYALTGRTKADAATVDLWSRIIHPEDLGKVLALLRKLVVHPQSAEIECRSYVHGGQLRWINILTRSEWDEREQRVTGIVGAVKDISERKWAQAAIAAEKERLAVTLRSIGDGVITTDVTGAIVIMNRVAEELTGWTQDEAAGQPLGSVFNIVDEITRLPCESPVERVLATGRRIELANHTLLTSRDGRESIIADSGAPITGMDGKRIGVVLVFRDVTERQKAIEAMQRAAKLDSLGVLAGGIAHDFNNLLAGIFGHVELARTASKDAAAIEYLDTVRATMNRARALTMQLLTFAKGGAPAQKPTALLPFLQDTVQFALSGSSVACRFAFAEDLWPCNIDKNQIAQAIDNIVINAQQAMPNGGTIAVAAVNILAKEKELAGLAGGRYVKVSIADQGVGIPKDVLPHIFDPFYTTKTKGHGLGLATCYSIVSRHGGGIDVESEPGRGSTFHVYLPASAEAVAANASAVVRQGGRGRVIVADDEAVVRETVRKMLESLGYSVICARDGREAIDLYVDEQKAGRGIEAMVLDLTIRGGLSGKEAVAELRKLDGELPVFVASGYADDPVMRKPAEYGFTGSIGKPFTIEELSDMLKRR
jgi:PAS domain S-box-containing protein